MRIILILNNSFFLNNFVTHTRTSYFKTVKIQSWFKKLFGGKGGLLHTKKFKDLKLTTVIFSKNLSSCEMSCVPFF